MCALPMPVLLQAGRRLVATDNGGHGGGCTLWLLEAFRLAVIVGVSLGSHVIDSINADD